MKGWMRFHLSAARFIPSPVAALPLLVVALAIVLVRPADASPRIGIGPAECVEAAAQSECDSAPAPRGGFGSAPSRGKTVSGNDEATGSHDATSPSNPGPPFRFFSPTSVWNTPLADDAPLDPESAAITADLNTEVQREVRSHKGPAINTSAFSVPIYTVPADQPTVPVTLRRSTTAAALRTAWSAVPLPVNAQPAAGTDRHLVVWQPSTDKLWEFWRLQHHESGWQADWGGAMQDVSSGSGVYGQDSWPGATPWWGASASSLSIAGGLITLEDLERGKIDHALAISLPQIRAGVYALPAQRTDGKSTNPQTLPEGAHLRLDPKVDIDALNLPPLTRMIAEAAQRYGIFVRDGASTVCLYAQDPTPSGQNPFLGPDGYFEGWRAPMDAFPWNRMQLLEMELTSTS